MFVSDFTSRQHAIYFDGQNFEFDGNPCRRLDLHQDGTPFSGVVMAHGSVTGSSMTEEQSKKLDVLRSHIQASQITKEKIEIGKSLHEWGWSVIPRHR